MSEKLEKYKLELFAIAGTIIVLWQMLLPGYVLTLDMVWGGSWITQKLFLIALFFALFYLPVKFFPFDIDSKFKYWAGIFFTVDPFVYERFLAGHWLLLLLYAMLPPLVYYLVKLFQNFKKYFLFFSFWLLAALLIFGFYFEHFTQILKISNPEYWQIFKTSSFLIGGSSAKVIMLYGFWGESYPWASYFIWPKLSLALPVFALIAGLVILGIRAAWLKNKKLTLVFLSVFALSFIFASGIGDGPFKQLNLWLFENIPFWRVFRDTTKWLAPMTYIYAVFGAMGVSFVKNFIIFNFINNLSMNKFFPPKADQPMAENIKKFKHYFEIKNLKLKIINVFVAALFILPLIYTYPMIGGFARQIKPVWYPESWYQVNNILKQDSKCKALFLPWHLYYSLSFNNNLITANPAPKFFDCEIVFSQNIEMEGMKQEVWPDWQDGAQKIKYVIYTPDLEGADIYDYSFLKSDAFKEIYQHKDIILFKIQLK